MTEFAGYTMRHPEGQRLADLVGVWIDLRQCDRLLAIFFSDLSENPDEYTLKGAITCAVVVTYARCFNNGVRIWPKDDAISQLSDQQREAHQLFYTMRDKHYAHSVNDMETNYPTVFVRSRPGHAPRIESIGHASTRVAWLEDEHMQSIRSAIASLLKFVKNAIRLEQDRLLPIAEQFGAGYWMQQGMSVESSDEMNVSRARPRVEKTRSGGDATMAPVRAEPAPKRELPQGDK